MAAAAQNTGLDSSTTTAGRGGFKWPIAVVLVAGLLARLIALSFAPKYAYLADHLDYMGWAAYIHQNGLTSAYNMPAGIPIPYHAFDSTGAPRVMLAKTPHACNYPPLGVYVFWMQGVLWKTLDTPAAMPSGAAAQPPDVAMPPANTMIARGVNALPSVIGDLVLAFGVAGMVRRLRGRPSRGWIELAALGVTWLAPPIVMDSSFWNQADSWIACLMVWTLNNLLDRRFLLAGVVYGLALVTKPQAILLGPVLGFAFVVQLMTPGQLRAAIRSLLILIGGSAASAALVALPFMVKDAGTADGALRWFKNSYQETLTTQSYQRVTLNAFNLWMLDSVTRPAPRSPEDVSDQALLLGVRKAVIGKLLLALGVLAAFGLCLRLRSVSSEAEIICAFLVMFAAFSLPTGVHERYIYYCIPFAIALAFVRRRWIPPLALLLLVGAFEMVSYRFVQMGNPTSRSQAAVLSILVMVAFAWSFAVAAMKIEKLPARK